MKIEKVLIEDKIKEKILYRHNISATEVKEILFNNPLFFKTRGNRYLAIGHHTRHITIILEIKTRIAFIITAYPSSDAQRKLYKLHRK